MRVLLGWSKVMYLPSGVNSPNEVVVAVTGHSVFSVLVVVVRVRVVFSSGLLTLVSLVWVWVVRHPASTRVPFQVVVVVVVVCSVCAHRKPAKSGTMATAANFFIAPPLHRMAVSDVTKGSILFAVVRKATGRGFVAISSSWEAAAPRAPRCRRT